MSFAKKDDATELVKAVRRLLMEGADEPTPIREKIRDHQVNIAIALIDSAMRPRKEKR